MILKVCGITNQEDADAAIEAGANALGFNFYPKSPRFLTFEQAGEITTPPGVLRVGVFVHALRREMDEAAAAARLDVTQIHGAGDYPAGTLWRALQVGPDFNIEREDDHRAEALLFDGPAGSLYGGGGKTFDWTLVRGMKRRIIVAGGLDASNVVSAIEVAQPWGVDACSRIESAPGKKDHQKMKAYLRAAMAALQA